MKTKLTSSLLLIVIALSYNLKAQAPYFQWAHQFGGQQNQTPHFITTDNSNNIITIGNFADSVDFDPDTSIVKLGALGLSDIFIQKLTPKGDLLWVNKIGGNGEDYGVCVTSDAFGNVYSTGRFRDTVDFDPGPGVVNLNSDAQGANFIQKLDSNGNFIWAKKINQAGCSSLTVDNEGNLYAIGSFNISTDFDPGTGVSILTSAGQQDIFILKLNSSGNFCWVKQMGGTYNDHGVSLRVDLFGNIITSGTFKYIVDFDPGPGVYNLNAPLNNTNSQRHGFIQKLDSNGNFVWAKQMTSDAWVQPNSISTDLLGNIYSGGSFRGTADFDPGSGTINLTTGTIVPGWYHPDDIYVQKLDPLGNLLWVKQMGGSGYDIAKSIDIDASGNVYTVGSFGWYGATADFDPGVGVINLISTGTSNGYLHKMDSSGNFLWVKQMAGTTSVSTSCVALDGLENIYTAGAFEGTVNLDSAATINFNSSGQHDIFIQKLNQCNSYSTDVHSACGSYTWIDSITYTSTNNSATYTLQNSGGCDSVITLNLTILESNTTDVHTVCDSLTWIDGITYTSSNDSVTNTLQNMNGCDSIVTLDLTVLESTHSTYSFAVCDSFTWIDGNTYTSSNNTAKYRTNNAAGCDSVITLNLTIESVSDVTTQVNGSTITANNKNGAYQWLDCSNGFATVSNETDSSFTATKNGSYAVQITENGCIDTSACITLNSISLDAFGINNSSVIHPNPTSGKFSITLGTNTGKVKVTLTDVRGAIISSTEYANTLNIETEINGPAGVYFVIINSSEDMQTFKVIKE